MLSIGIDGPASSGKSATGKFIANKLGFLFIDTGLMYRACAYIIMANKINYENKLDLIEFLKNLKLNFDKNIIYCNGLEIKPCDLFSNPVVRIVSKIAGIKILREKLVEIQRKMAEYKNVIMVGRDVGTVILPNANLKIYLTASAKVRAQRRLSQNESLDVNTTFKDLVEQIKQRDRIDSTRVNSPLKQAEDAILIDNSSINLIETTNLILKIWNSRNP